MGKKDTNGTYHKLKTENAELKEKLSLYQNGIFNAETERSITVPDSFVELANGSLSHLDRTIDSDPDLIEEALFEIYNSFPIVLVTLHIGKKTTRLQFQAWVWECITNLGYGDTEKGLGVLVAKYRMREQREQLNE